MFVLEDRVTARTNSGENEPEGNPNNTPEASTVVASIVGNFTPSEWGQNITDQILELKVRTCALLESAFTVCSAYGVTVLWHMHQPAIGPCLPCTLLRT